MKVACAMAMFLALVAVPGCGSPRKDPGSAGSPSGSPEPDAAVPDSPGPDSTVPGSPGPDAVILAIRMETGIALDTNLAAQFDRLLVLARTADPTTLSDIHARSDASLVTMLIRATGRVADAFGRGDLRT